MIEHYEFDLCFIFTKTNSDKIIIEDEYFIQKSITLIDLSELIEEDKVILVLDKNIENSSFQIKVADNDSQIKRLLASIIYKELKLEKGNFRFYKLSTELPELIDVNNFDKFVGRNTDIENLVKKVSILENEKKVLIIKGAGGIGKTTLLSKIVDEFAQRGKFKDGIKFVQCEFIKDYEDFENKISFAFDMSNAINFKTQLKEQIDQEEEKRLIILDNVETILHLEDTNKIKEFIKFISDFATIVITSREKLNEDFELVYELREFTTDEAEELFLNYYELKQYDSKFLRIEILENMLNNNPLAIKLVTSNLPKNKDLRLLRKELDNGFFDITSKSIEDIFEKESDINIQRTKSLFNSINYSYLRLSTKEQLALELLSLFLDGIHFENFKNFYNKKEDKGKSNQKTIKKKIENFSDRDLKSLEDKSLIVNTNQLINLQSIIGRFADYKFKHKSEDEKKEYYKKAYGYNNFILQLINDNNTLHFVSAYIFDNNKENFLKCLDYFQYVDISEEHISFFNDLRSNFGFCSSPNSKIIHKLEQLNSSNNNNQEIKVFLEISILVLDYFYGRFDTVFEVIKKEYPLQDIFDNYNSYTKIEKLYINEIVNIYGMEGNQYDEVKIDLSVHRFNISSFYIGDYLISQRFLNRTIQNNYVMFELKLNLNILEITKLRNYIKKLYKTEFIEKVQSTYILIKANKAEVSLKEIKALIVTNPFTDGLKTLMLAIKDEKNCSKKMYEDAIEKLYHIRYYHVEAILLYSEYLKEKKDEDYYIWLQKGKELAIKHYYRYLLHRFNCLEQEIDKPYDENDYPLPEELDYSEVIKKYKV